MEYTKKERKFAAFISMIVFGVILLAMIVIVLSFYIFEVARSESEDVVGEVVITLFSASLIVVLYISSLVPAFATFVSGMVACFSKSKPIKIIAAITVTICLIYSIGFGVYIGVGEPFNG